MTSYRYANLSIKSNIPIPELRQSNRSRENILFNLEWPKFQSTDFDWLNYWENADGKPVLFYSRMGTDHWLRFPGLADFQILGGSAEIHSFPVPGIPEDTIRHLLLDQVLPRHLAHQGWLVLHASAVQLSDGVVLFIGGSGTGKSTIAGYFHRSGHPVLSDDVVLVDAGRQPQALAAFSYNGLRLWGDSLQELFPCEKNALPMAHYSNKKRVQLNSKGRAGSNSSLPILAAIVLSNRGQILGEQVHLTPLSRREAFIQILNETFQLDSFHPDERTCRTRSLGLMVTKTPAFGLSVIRNYGLLPNVHRIILDTLLNTR